MFKKFLLFLISFILILNSFSVFALNESIYYYASEKLIHGNVIFTYTIEKPFDGLYDNAQTTRAEFAAVLLNALRIDVPPVTENSYFQDCDIKDWYTPYINKVFELRIVSGYGNDNFMPKNIVTNFEAVTMLVRCLGYDDIKVENETYPYKYLEIAEQLDLFKNTTINVDNDEPIDYGNLFVLLLNAMRCDVYNTSLKLWDYGSEWGVYKKVTGNIKSVKGHEIIVNDGIEDVNLTYGYEEGLSEYLDENVIVWYIDDYVIDMIRL